MPHFFAGHQGEQPQAKPPAKLTADPKKHLQEGDFADQDHHEARAGMSKHHCTDLTCLTVFVIAVAGLCGIFTYAGAKGDVRRIFRGYNFTGHLCGVDDPDRPLLYWCQKPIAGQVTIDTMPILDLKHPICVQACPTSSATKHTCFSGVDRSVNNAPVTLANGGFTLVESNKYLFAEVPDYKSSPFLSRYCLPDDQAMKAQLLSALNNHTMTNALMDVSQLSSAWVPLTCAVIIAFIMGYVYLFFLERGASCMVYSAIALVVVLGTLLGLYLIISTFTGGIDGIPGTGGSKVNWITGLILLSAALLFGCFACCAHEHIEVAIGCVEAAADCMFQMPSLFMEPLCAMACKILLFVILVSGFLLLASVGKVKTMTLEQFTAKYELVPGGEVSGVFRTFQYRESEVWLMSYYIFVSIWIFGLLTAISQFVMAYSVQLWYFTPYQEPHDDHSVKVGLPTFTIFRGYWMGGYHLGSLAFGSLLLTFLFVIKVLLSILAKAAEHEGNGVVALIAKCALCCVSCYERCLSFLNKNAYMDIAINSTTFCTAAQNALAVIATESAAVTFLNGACWVFTLAGCAMITASGSFLVWIMVRTLWWFNNIESKHYIHNPILVCTIAGVICFIVAIGFMLIFDTVADTILFCYATDQMRKKEGTGKGVHYAPHHLEDLIEKHSPEEPHSNEHHWYSGWNESGHSLMGYHSAAAGGHPVAGGHPSGTMPPAGGASSGPPAYHGGQRLHG
jgi:hypothetical protein